MRFWRYPRHYPHLAASYGHFFLYLSNLLCHLLAQGHPVLVARLALDLCILLLILALVLLLDCLYMEIHHVGGECLALGFLV